MEEYLKIFTFLPFNEIQQLMEAHRVKFNHSIYKEKSSFSFQAKPHEYVAQIKLAKQITLLVHGGDAFRILGKINLHFCSRKRIGISNT